MEKNDSKKLDSLLENVPEMALKRRYKKVIGSLDLKKGNKLLDMGCGDGFFLHLLVNLDLKIDLVGADYDKAALKSAQKNLEGSNIKFVGADLMKKTKFRSNSFDRVVMNEVVEHLPDDVKGLKEIYRILKKKGILCLTVPNHNYPFFWDPINYVLERMFNTHIKQGFFSGIWNQHERLYFVKDIKKVVSMAGFKILETKPLTHWTLPFNHYLINLGARLIYDNHLPADLKRQVSKFEGGERRNIFVITAFRLMNFVDSLNEGYKGDSTSNIFIKAQKL